MCLVVWMAGRQWPWQWLMPRGRRRRARRSGILSKVWRQWVVVSVEGGRSAFE